MTAVLVALEGLVFRLLWGPLLHRWYTPESFAVRRLSERWKRRGEPVVAQLQQGVLL